jgi:hypothetical protein
MASALFFLDLKGKVSASKKPRAMAMMHSPE